MPVQVVTMTSCEPRRVLMTADTVGGVWIYALELASALARHGVEIILATMGELLRPEQRAAAGQLANVQVFESCYRLEWMANPWDDVAAAGEWLRDLEHALQPDLVHLNGYVHAALPWRSPVVVVAHSCVLSWWRAVRGEDAPPDWDRYRGRVREGLSSADLVVAPTQAMLDAVLQHYRPRVPTRVIANGREPAASQEAATKEPFIFAAGRFWDQAKNLASLAACSAAMPWPVYIAGDTRHPDGGEPAARGPNMHFLGKLTPSGVAWWLARASIYALPARYEPFGLSALEAALAGCALVLGDIPSLREVWDDAALFVPPDEPDALERALRCLIDDDTRRAHLGQRARERALGYTPARMARAYLDAYHELIAARA